MTISSSMTPNSIPTPSSTNSDADTSPASGLRGALEMEPGFKVDGQLNGAELDSIVSGIIDSDPNLSESDRENLAKGIVMLNYYGPAQYETLQNLGLFTPTDAQQMGIAKGASMVQNRLSAEEAVMATEDSMADGFGAASKLIGQNRI